MTVQITSEIRNVNLSLGLANRGVSVCEVETHSIKDNKIYETSKTILVERYQKMYLVEYAIVLDELQIWAVNGIADVEDTFNESFIEAMEDAAKLAEVTSKDNDEEYDEYFQNQ